MAMGGGIFKGLSAGSIIAGLILLAVAFQAVASTMPDVQLGLTEVSNTSAPLSGLFAGGHGGTTTGVVILALVGAIILATLGVLGLVKGKR